MVEDLLSKDRRVEKKFATEEIRTIDLPIHNIMHCLLVYPSLLVDMLQQISYQLQIYFGVGAIEITQKRRTKAWKSHLRSQRLFQKKSAKTVMQKICMKRTKTFTIISMNFMDLFHWCLPQPNGCILFVPPSPTHLTYFYIRIYYLMARAL